MIANIYKHYNPLFIVSYLKSWDKEGTSYNQRVRMNKYNLLMINEEIKKEIAEGYKRSSLYCPNGDYYAAIFLKELDVNSKKNYLNLTQLAFINLVCGVSLKNRNTYIVLGNSDMCSFSNLRQK